MRTSTVTTLFAVVFATGAFGQQATAPKPVAAAPPPQPRSAMLSLVPYPAKKQSTTQQAKDDGECFDWTRQSTGIDLSTPVAVADSTSAAPAKGTRARGALRGAAAGAIAGEVIDDKGGEGAAIGAAAGAARSGRQERARTEQAKKESAAAADSAEAQRLDTFRKGYSACMEARGYTIR